LDFDAIRACVLTKRGATEEYPFGPYTLVFKVGGSGGKVFALLGTEKPTRISLKCDPLYAEDLRALYPAIQPGYHLNKRHWNTVSLDGSVSDDLLLTLLDESYALVVRGLPRALRELLPPLGQ